MVIIDNKGFFILSFWGTIVDGKVIVGYIVHNNLLLWFCKQKQQIKKVCKINK